MRWLNMAAGTAAAMLAVSVAAFVTLKAMPGDPVAIAVHAWNLPATDATFAALRSEWGLDRSLIDQYGLWLSRFLRGDWGQSFRTGRPVLQEFLIRLPVSLTIGGGGLLVAALGSMPLGFAAARRPGGFADTLSRGLAIGAQAVPAFWLGLILIWILAVKLGLMEPFGGGGSAILLSIFLVAFHSLGVLSRVYARDMMRVAARPFFRTAIAKGLSRDRALFDHAHAHAAYAMVSAVRAEAGWAIGGGATVEVLFGIAGIGQFLVESIGSRDYAVLQAYILTVALWMALVNAVVHLTLSRIDPTTE